MIMKYRNLGTGKVREWTEEIGPEGKIIMVSEDGVRWLLGGTPFDVELPYDFPRTPLFLNCNVPVIEDESKA
jgi:hypothetical protein